MKSRAEVAALELRPASTSLLRSSTLRALAPTVGCVMRTVLLVVAFALGAQCACAQESTAQDSSYEKKQKRLNITGWTLIGAGAAFPSSQFPSRRCVAEIDSTATWGDVQTTWLR